MSGYKITDFPTEILEKIFWHVDDTTSAIAAGVCKRFNEVLDVTVRRKYNGSSRSKWYDMEIFDENENHEIVQHRPFILKRVSAIKLTFRAELNNRDHWIHQVINRIGRSIKMVRLTTPLYDAQIRVNFYNILSKTPNISHLRVDYVYPTSRKWCHQRYKQLTHLEMRLRTLFDDEELKPFVKNNRQLKNVHLEITYFRLLYVFDQTNIESLHCRLSPMVAKDIPVNIQTIRMAQLKSINLQVPKNSMNQCIERIVAPCQNLQKLRLMEFDDFTLTDESIDILSTFRSMETFEIGFSVPLKVVVRLIKKLSTLVQITLWHKTFTIDDYRVLLEAANKHPTLRRINFQREVDDILNQSLLSWLMENVNDRIQLAHSLRLVNLVISREHVQCDGVTIMSSNRSSIEYGKVTHKWIEQLHIITSAFHEYYEFFSSLPMLRTYFDEKVYTHLHFSDETDEELVKRRALNTLKASTKLSDNYDRSVNCINWLEKYCYRVHELSIHIDNNLPQLPTWTLPELKLFRISSGFNTHTLDLTLFESFRCQQLKCFKLVGHYPVSLTNLQVVHDVNLFDNLVTLQIFHYNESMNDLLQQFNRNVRYNLRHLTLANRRIDFERYKMDNKTIIAIANYPNLTELKLILTGLNETNTKYLFENCTKVTELYIECNFLSTEKIRYDSSRLFGDIKSNCISLTRLVLVWHDRMMKPYAVSGIKSTFPNVFVKIMQIDDHMNTTAEKIIHEQDDGFERLFDEFEIEILDINWVLSKVEMQD